MSCSLRPVGRAHRAQLERLTRATGLFREDEVATAVELLDDSAGGGTDYRFIGAFDDSGEARGEDTLAGYACWGPTPGTRGTCDLYWIAVDPAWQRRGVGTELVRDVERRLIADGCRLVVIETSSRGDYEPTRRFYERRGYTRAATIPGYYAPGDDLVIYTKDLTDGELARAPS